MTFDPGMDRPPDRWTSPEAAVTFPEVPEHHPAPEDVDNPIGEVHFADAGEMHRESIQALRATNAALARVVDMLMGAGQEIIRIDAGTAAQSQRIRFRVQYLIVNRATAGTGTLGIGTASYPFVTDATPRRVDFPIVIDRGIDMTWTGDGLVYLVGWPE